MTQYVALDKEAHRDLRVRTEASADLGDDVMATMTVPIEFRQVQGHFPILFRRETGSDDFIALALFGFEQHENLFLESGRWDARYRPWSLVIRPFLVGRPESGEGEAQVHIDLGHPRVAATGQEGVPLFDADGIPTPFLEAMSERLGALDEGYRASRSFFDALVGYELLKPFSLEVTFDNGSKHSLGGFHIIDEAKLRELDAAALGALHAAGHLMPIFMALASLSQLTELVARRNRRLAGG